MIKLFLIYKIPPSNKLFQLSVISSSSTQLLNNISPLDSRLVSESTVFFRTHHSLLSLDHPHSSQFKTFFILKTNVMARAKQREQILGHCLLVLIVTVTNFIATFLLTSLPKSPNLIWTSLLVLFTHYSVCLAQGPFEE